MCACKIEWVHIQPTRVLFSMSNRTFYFQSLASPTQHNLHRYLLAAGFQQAANSKAADFSDKNLTLNEADTELLESKHLLASLVQKYCPQVMPATYVIHDHNFNEILDFIADAHNAHEQVWILKPALLNNAEGVMLFDDLEAVRTHFKGTKRFAGYHVLQRYVENPHLLNGHKYTFRMFVIITNFAGAYLYPHGYFNVSREKYSQENLQNLAAHLTNEHLNSDHSPNNWQVPTDRCPNFDVIYRQMQQTVTATVSALKKESEQLFCDNPADKAFSFFGYDFILDDELNLFMLEVNHCPCFPRGDDHPLQKYLYEPFWQEVIKQFVMPIVSGETVVLCNPKVFYQVA